jgi:hypothetical protein
MRIALAIAAALIATTSFAQEPDVDWKFYGGARLTDEASGCFFDAKGVTPLPENHLRVWTKCSLMKDMDNIDVAKDFNGKIMEDAAHKIANYYVPPLATVEKLEVQQAQAITMYEEIANSGYIQPQSRILYELDCPKQMLRELSISIQTDGKSSSINKPRDWQYIPPEGNAATLSKILCRAQ